MQWEVSDPIAIEFTQELYGALIDGADIDDAVTEARRAVYFIPGAAEWVMPVVYVRGSSYCIFG
jgi:hypothetical protein